MSVKVEMTKEEKCKLVAEELLGWRRGGMKDHTRPGHRISKDYPGTIINDFNSKGPHDYLESPDGKRVYFCGCESTTYLPDFYLDEAENAKVLDKLKGRIVLWSYSNSHWDVDRKTTVMEAAVKWILSEKE